MFISRFMTKDVVTLGRESDIAEAKTTDDPLSDPPPSGDATGRYTHRHRQRPRYSQCHAV